MKELLHRDGMAMNEQLRADGHADFQLEKPVHDAGPGARRGRHAGRDAGAKLYESYQRNLKASNAVDFDDLIMLPVQLFQTHPDVFAEVAASHPLPAGDEYQDTNNMQYCW